MNSSGSKLNKKRETWIDRNAPACALPICNKYDIVFCCSVVSVAMLWYVVLCYLCSGLYSFVCDVNDTMLSFVFCLHVKYCFELLKREE